MKGPSDLVDSAGSGRPSPLTPRPSVHSVQRRRLSDCLDEQLALVIVRAPVGYGKTTMLSEWAGRRGLGSGSVVWISSRSSAPDLWTQLMVALRPEVGDLTADRDDDRVVLPEHLHSVLDQHDGEVIVVIDDFDALAPDVDELLLELLRTCHGLRVVVSMAGSDRLPSARRLEIDCVELTAGDLAFTAEETTQLAEVLGSTAPSGVVDALHHDLAGWPAAVKAALTAIGRTPPAGLTIEDARRAADEYLAGHLPGPDLPGVTPVATFVLAIPEELTADVVAALPIPEAGQAFRAAVAQGLVYRADQDSKGTFRWPPAVRRLLLARAVGVHSELGRDVHRGLAEYYGRVGRHTDELRHIVATEDWPAVVATVDRAWGALFTSDRAQVHSALARIPSAALRGFPRAQVVRALVIGLPDAEIRAVADAQLQTRSRSDDAVETETAILISVRVRGMWDRARVFADRVASGAVVAQRSGMPGTRRLSVRMLQVGITRVLSGDLAGSIPALQTAHRESHHSDRRYAAADAASKLACVLAVRGELSRAAHWLDDFEQRDPRHGSITEPIRTTALVGRLLVAIGTRSGRVADDTARSLLTTTENQEFWGFRLYALARLAISSGSPAWGQQLLSDARALFRSDRAEGMLMPVPGGVTDALMLSAEVDLLLATGHATRARRILDESIDHVLLRSSRARLALLTDDPETAVLWSSRGVADPMTAPGQLIELLLVRALARNRIGDPAGAKTDLRQTANLIRVHGNVDAVRTVPRDELIMVAGNDSGITDVLSDPSLTDSQDMFPASIELVTLTDREALLLDLLDGEGNLATMADRLHVSVNTLKSQRRTLYQKLRAGSRDQALVRAREWGLIDSPAHRYGWTRSLRVPPT